MPVVVPECCAHASLCMHGAQLASSRSKDRRGQHANTRQLDSWRRAKAWPFYTGQPHSATAAAAAVDIDELELDAPLIDADLRAVQADAGASFNVRAAQADS